MQFPREFGAERRDLPGELPIPNTSLPAAICRFRARKIDVVTEVARRKSWIQVAEERRVEERGVETRLKRERA